MVLVYSGEEILNHNIFPLLQEIKLLSLTDIMLAVSYGTQIRQTYEDNLQSSVS